MCNRGEVAFAGGTRAGHCKDEIVHAEKTNGEKKGPELGRTHDAFKNGESCKQRCDEDDERDAVEHHTRFHDGRTFHRHAHPVSRMHAERILDVERAGVLLVVLHADDLRRAVLAFIAFGHCDVGMPRLRPKDDAFFEEIFAVEDAHLCAHVSSRFPACCRIRLRPSCISRMESSRDRDARSR